MIPVSKYTAILYMCSGNAVYMHNVTPQPYISVLATASPARVYVCVLFELLFFSDLASIISQSDLDLLCHLQHALKCLAPQDSPYLRIDLYLLAQLTCYYQISRPSQNSPSCTLSLFAAPQELEKLAETQDNRHHVGHDINSCCNCVAPGSAP